MARKKKTSARIAFSIQIPSQVTARNSADVSAWTSCRHRRTASAADEQPVDRLLRHAVAPRALAHAEALRARDPPQRIDVHQRVVEHEVRRLQQLTRRRLGLNADQTIQVPPVEQPMQAGWYDKAPTPGEIGPAVILGHTARAEMKRTGEGGEGFALAGLILGWLSVAGWAFFFLLIMIAETSSSSGI